MSLKLGLKDFTLPRWLHLYFLHKYGRDYSYKTGINRCLDHWGTDPKTGDLISHLYSVDMQCLQRLIEICTDLGTEFYITGYSEWHTDTLKLVIKNPIRKEG